MGSTAVPLEGGGVEIDAASGVVSTGVVATTPSVDVACLWFTRGLWALKELIPEGVPGSAAWSASGDVSKNSTIPSEATSAVAATPRDSPRITRDCLGGRCRVGVPGEVDKISKTFAPASLGVISNV